MKNINKLIVQYVCEILIVIVFVVISFPVWKLLDRSNVAKIANSYSTMDYLYLDIDKYVGNKEFEDSIAIVNDTNTLRGYELVLKIANDKITDNIMIEINDNIQNLNELKYNEDKEFSYFKIAEGNVVASKSNYTVKLINSDISYNQVEYLISENHEV